MNIVQIISGTGVNGAVRHCLDLTCQLAQRGHQVVLAHKPGAWIAQNPLPENVELVETSLKRRLGEFRRLAHEFRDRRIDVIHSHNSSAHAFSVLLAQFYRFPKVATCHMPHFQPHWWWNDCVIAPTPSTARYQRWINWVPRRRIEVIPNFIEVQRLQPQRTREQVRAELGIEPTTFLIVCIGDVCPRKNQLLLVRALAEIRQRGQDAAVVLAGTLDETYRVKLEKFIQQAGLASSIRMLGQRRDVPDLLAAGDCFCLPSQREVMPISCLEAMAAGIPIVTTDVGGLAELIRNGEDGFVVERNDLAGLTEALGKLAADAGLRRRLAASARAKVAREFSPEACVPRIIECYQRVCAKRS